MCVQPACLPRLVGALVHCIQDQVYAKLGQSLDDQQHDIPELTERLCNSSSLLLERLESISDQIPFLVESLGKKASQCGRGIALCGIFVVEEPRTNEECTALRLGSLENVVRDI